MAIDSYQLDDTLRMDFTVSDPTDEGALIDADAAPDIEIYEDGDTAATLTTTAAKRDAGTTGQYSFSAALTAGNGFEIGKTYNVYALATVNTKNVGRVIGTFRIEAKALYVN